MSTYCKSSCCMFWIFPKVKETRIGKWQHFVKFTAIYIYIFTFLLIFLQFFLLYILNIIQQLIAEVVIWLFSQIWACSHILLT